MEERFPRIGPPIAAKPVPFVAEHPPGRLAGRYSQSQDIPVQADDSARMGFLCLALHSPQSATHGHCRTFIHMSASQHFQTLMEEKKPRSVLCGAKGIRWEKATASPPISNSAEKSVRLNTG